MKKTSLFTFFLVSLFALPDVALVYAGDFYVSGWIPYWRAEKGIESALLHIEEIDEINPFIYTVKKDGTLYNNVSLTDKNWKKLRQKTDELDIKFIPTVMWAEKETIFALLSDEGKRRAHIQSIAQEVYKHDLDGIDIDYENKSAETRLYFSLFLKELNEAIGYDRDIVCTIESRMPVEDRYSEGATIPTFIEYSNDFSKVNQYCDRVNIMAYDQGRADQTLNREMDDPYIPVGDVTWVEKVMRVAAEEIDPSKLSVGVATYGYEYDMFPSINNIYPMSYSRLWSFNPGYATELAATLGLTPTRNSAGELSLVFPASQSTEEIPLPDATRVLSWSDAEAISDKAALAKTLGLHGIAIFKIDGGEDEAMWPLLAAVRGQEVQNTTNALPKVTRSVTETVAPYTPRVLSEVPSRNLELDDTGEDVRALQRLLNEAGFTVSVSGPGSPGNETSLFGYATQDAIIRFQKAHSISPAVGYYGPKTREKMSGVVLVTVLSRDLEIGDVGEDVRTLQAILNRIGFVVAPSGGGSPGEESMYFGAKTKAAVIKYQSTRGITPTVGYVGPKTRGALAGE